MLNVGLQMRSGMGHRPTCWSKREGLKGTIWSLPLMGLGIGPLPLTCMPEAISRDLAITLPCPLVAPPNQVTMKFLDRRDHPDIHWGLAHGRHLVSVQLK